MNVYVTRDYEPLGGFYSGSTLKDVGPFAEEIRAVAGFPDDVWQQGMTSGFPLDPDGTSDSFWFGHFRTGTTIWSK